MEIMRKYGTIIIACALAFAMVNASANPLVYDKQLPQNLDSLAKVYNNTGVDYLISGNHEMASEMFIMSLRLRESIPNFPKARLANGYLNLAILKQDMSYIDSAIFYYRKTEAILLSIENPPSSTLGITYYAYGDCLNYNQDYKSAIAYIQKGINLLSQDSLSNSKHLVLASIKLSAAYRGAGMFDEALRAAKNSLVLSKRFNHIYFSNANSAIGLSYLALEDYSNAVKYFKDVEELIVKGEKWRPSDLMALYSNLGTTHRHIEENDLARLNFLKGVEIAESSSTFSPQLGLLLRNYALFLKSNCDLDNAEKYFLKSLNLNTKDQTTKNYFDLSLSSFYSPLIAIQCFEGLGYVNLERFLLSKEKTFAQKSFQFFSRAISFMDEQRAGVLDDGDKLYIDDIYHSLYLNTIKACFTFVDYIPGAIDFAFKVSSKAKAAVLNQAISKERGLSFSGVPQDLIFQEKDLRQRVSALYELYNEEKLKANSSVKQLQSIEGRVFDAQRDYKQLIGSIEIKYPEYYALMYDTTSVSIREIQGKLKPSQVLIDYIISDSLLICFAITQKDFNWQSKILTENFFDSLEVFLHEVNPSSFENLNRSNLERYANASFYLYQVLIKPIESIIQDRELLIVPHQLLSAIPFAALTSSNVDSPRGYYSLPYLVKSNPISYYPSTKLFYTARSPSKSLSIKSISYAPSYENSSSFQSSTLLYRQNLGDLPGAENEAKVLSKLLKGDLVAGSKATEKHFKGVAQLNDLLHLAMHTHIDEKNPLFSKLIFSASSDTTEDGFLNMYEVYGLKLNAKLVIISACRSGDGNLIRGEGLLSLARGFQYAGSQSLIAAQWRIDDFSGSEVMIEFSKNLVKGIPQNIALQRAQVRFLHSADPLRSHPYFWASYQLIGYSGALVYPFYLKIFIWVASIIIGLILIGYILWSLFFKGVKN
jgi:CHAT domain-containing protein